MSAALPAIAADNEMDEFDRAISALFDIALRWAALSKLAKSLTEPATESKFFTVPVFVDDLLPLSDYDATAQDADPDRLVHLQSTAKLIFSKFSPELEWSDATDDLMATTAVQKRKRKRKDKSDEMPWDDDERLLFTGIDKNGNRIEIPDDYYVHRIRIYWSQLACSVNIEQMTLLSTIISEIFPDQGENDLFHQIDEFKC